MTGRNETNGSPQGARHNPLDQIRHMIGVPLDDDFPDIPTPTIWPRSPPLTPLTSGNSCEPGSRTYAGASPTSTTTSSPAVGGATTSTSKRWLPCAITNAPATPTPLPPQPRSTGSAPYATSPPCYVPGPRNWAAPPATKTLPRRCEPSTRANGNASSKSTSSADSKERSMTPPGDGTVSSGIRIPGYSRYVTTPSK